MDHNVYLECETISAVLYSYAFEKKVPQTFKVVSHCSWFWL